MIYERVLRCSYCQREMTCSATAHAENPFCVECFDDRLRETTQGAAPRWRIENGYLKREDPQTHS